MKVSVRLRQQSITTITGAIGTFVSSSRLCHRPYL